MRLQPLLLLGQTCLLCFASLGCDTETGTGPTARATAPSEATNEATEVKIKIADLAFDPPTVTVRAGTKVTWTNQDEVPHTVTSTTKPRVLESHALDTNDSFSHVFKEPGTYKYFCKVHPKMAGTVVVKESKPNQR